MVTIIDEDNLVTEDGVELVSKRFYYKFECKQCYYASSPDCSSIPCFAGDRKDRRNVIFVEKAK